MIEMFVYNWDKKEHDIIVTLSLEHLREVPGTANFNNRHVWVGPQIVVGDNALASTVFIRIPDYTRIAICSASATTGSVANFDLH